MQLSREVSRVSNEREGKEQLVTRAKRVLASGVVEIGAIYRVKWPGLGYGTVHRRQRWEAELHITGTYCRYWT